MPRDPDENRAPVTTATRAQRASRVLTAVAAYAALLSPGGLHAEPTEGPRLSSGEEPFSTGTGGPLWWIELVSPVWPRTRAARK